MRKICVTCSRKRLLKYMYLLDLPYVYRVVWVCNECYAKYINYAKVKKSAEVDKPKA